MIVDLVKRVLRAIGKFVFLIGQILKPVNHGISWCMLQVRRGYISSFFLKCGNDISIKSPYRIIGYKYISIGQRFTSLHGLRIEAFDSYLNQTFSPSIVIGNNVCFNTDCHIGCINSVVIGDNVLIASRVFITDHSHGDTYCDKHLSPSNRLLVSKGPVIIGNNVWIGEGVVILPNVKIGDNCIVGANSVVTKDVPKDSVIAGVPAKIIKNLK